MFFFQELYQNPTIIINEIYISTLHIFSHIHRLELIQQSKVNNYVSTTNKTKIASYDTYIHEVTPATTYHGG